MNSRERWTVGVTHLIEPPFEPETQAFDGKANFVHFPSRDENKFSPTALPDLDAFLVWTPSINEVTISRLTKCRIIVRYGVGYDKIDLPGLEGAGIAFSNNPEYGPEDVADTAMGMILTLQRRLMQHDALAKSYSDTWQENHLTPMLHSPSTTVGIIGLGRIGTSVARRLAPFGYKVVAYDPYISNGMFRALQVERIASLKELIERVDVLTLHCPLTAETESMINRELLEQAKPGVLLINTARGKLIASLDEVEHYLRTGKIGGIGLDVLPEEPPGSHPLIDAWRQEEAWTRGRVIITPHNAFFSNHSMNECRFAAAETARLFLEEGIHRNGVARI
jgi:phosphoglycerate dehydrogenase-like enzyme